MLPTPVADNSRGLPSDGTDYQSLMNAVMTLLPTPAAKEPGGTAEQYQQRLRDHDGREGSLLPLSMVVQNLLPTPTDRDHKDSQIRREPHRPDSVDTLARALADETTAALFPAPRATDGTKGGPNQRGSSGDLMLPSAVQLLPTPRTVDVSSIRTSQRSRDLYSSGDSMGDIVERQRWDEYGSAIRRWEKVLGRAAPDPTKPNSKGKPKLSDEFDEFLMGYPAGWITNVPGVTWNQTLKMCGNGVVPQQAAAAVRWLLAMGGPR